MKLLRCKSSSMIQCVIESNLNSYEVRKFDAIQYNLVQIDTYNLIGFGTLCDLVHFGTILVQSGAIWFFPMESGAVWCNLIRFGANRWNLVESDASWYNMVQLGNMSQLSLHVGIYNLVQSGAIWYDLLQSGNPKQSGAAWAISMVLNASTAANSHFCWTLDNVLNVCRQIFAKSLFHSLTLTMSFVCVEYEHSMRLSLRLEQLDVEDWASQSEFSFFSKVVCAKYERKKIVCAAAVWLLHAQNLYAKSTQFFFLYAPQRPGASRSLKRAHDYKTI